MTINTKKFFNENELPDLPGLGGGGGGTDAITLKSMDKSFGKRVKDIGNILTRPFKETKVDPNEKFASEFPSGDGGSIDFDMVKKLGGLGGGGGGTNAITSKAKTKTIGNYVKDAFKISTIPARFLLGIESPEDPLSKFAAPSTPKDKVSSAISSYNQMIEPNMTEQNNVKTIANSINQSVGQSGGMTTVIQPVVNNIQVPTPVPQPTPVPVKGKTNTIVIDGKNNNTLAKLIR